MKNFKQPGKMLRVIAGGPTGGVVAGQLCAIGDFVGVAANTVAQGVLTGHELSLLGVYAVTKAAGVAINQGDKVYALFTNTKADGVNTTSASRVFAGWAFRPALAGDATVEVLLPMGGFSEM